MRLFEHPDFEQAVFRAAEHFRPRGLREAIIEKDYFVTEAPRIIERSVGDQVIFKGGTSLSKGWNLIQRFESLLLSLLRLFPLDRLFCIGGLLLGPRQTDLRRGGLCEFGFDLLHGRQDGLQAWR